MFILTKLADLVQIKPEEFGKDDSQAIEDYINAKYANKVYQNVGLCICFYDLLYASDGQIGHGTGNVNINVEFRLIVFRPFRGETMTGTISSASQDGMKLRTPFFDEIWIPKEELPHGCFFHHPKQLWIWKTPEEEELFYDPQEAVRFRVLKEEWVDQAPKGARSMSKKQQDDPLEKTEDEYSPYGIQGAMEDSGLGPCLWWEEEES